MKILVVIMLGTCVLTFSVSFIFNNALAKHQRDRINIILGKELSKEAKRGIAYNLNQSKIAIGSGGIIGKGYLHGTQTRYNYVPETSTDFIFSAIGEEWGFMGSLILIAITGTLMVTHGKNTFKRRGWKLAVAGIIFPILVLIILS